MHVCVVCVCVCVCVYARPGLGAAAGVDYWVGWDGREGLAEGGSGPLLGVGSRDGGGGAIEQ